MSNQLEQTKSLFHNYVKELQDEITQYLVKIDPEITIKEDLWERQDAQGNDGGGGRTRAFTGNLIENAGVNTSLVYGKVRPEFAKSIGGTNDEMWATGISLIIHPKNPRVPTTHANFRMIQAGEKFWFGGGADLTPYFPYENDFRFFHSTWKRACAEYGTYDKWKAECDRYFTNHHRNNEMRGIGGIFFDHYNSGDLEADSNMVMDLGKSFIPSYFPILEKRKSEAWTQEDEDFQLHRRGRYVEFNLLHDRGTSFGLKSNGRTDSILISLPARCKFSYQYAPKKGSEHEKMLEYYYPKDWA